MKRIASALAVMVGLSAQPAWATPAGTEAEQAALSHCIVMSTTGADRALTAQWIFSAMSKSPQIANLSAVSDQRRVELDKAFAQLVTRLVIKDCFAEIRPLAAKNLESAFEMAGQALGEIAMKELMGNPSVDKAIGAYTDYMSEEDFKPLIDCIDKDQSK